MSKIKELIQQNQNTFYDTFYTKLCEEGHVDKDEFIKTYRHLTRGWMEDEGDVWCDLHSIWEGWMGDNSGYDYDKH